MIFTQLAIIPVLVLGMTAVFLLVNAQWRASIVALTIQYIAVFWLVALVWPVGLATVKLVAGWMAGAVLFASRPEQDLEGQRPASLSGVLFRMVSAGLVLALVISVYPLAIAHLPVQPQVLEGGLVLVGLGLLHLGMSAHPLRVVLGLLNVLSGFELLYAGLETSILIAGMQAMVTLGLALVGAYLLGVHTAEENG
jgi:hypothetical protein